MRTDIQAMRPRHRVALGLIHAGDFPHMRSDYVSDLFAMQSIGVQPRYATCQASMVGALLCLKTGRAACPGRGQWIKLRPSSGPQNGTFDIECTPKPMTTVIRRDGIVCTRSSRLACSTSSRWWQDANGWSEPSPSPTYSWRMAALVDRFDGPAGRRACRGHVARATARPFFLKAHADRMAIFLRPTATSVPNADGRETTDHRRFAGRCPVGRVQHEPLEPLPGCEQL